MSLTPGSSATRVLADFPGDRPDFLAVSPDGNQLAFDLGDPFVTENHVFVMSMDGSGLRQLYHVEPERGRAVLVA